MPKYIQCCELLSLLGSFQRGIDEKETKEQDWFAVLSYNLLDTLSKENRLCLERCRPFFLKVELSQLNKTFE